MSQSLIGFLRGIAYVVIFAVLDYISTHLAGSGLVSGGVATLVTGLIASLEHFLNDPNIPAVS
jgi:hypothetical protein